MLDIINDYQFGVINDNIKLEWLQVQGAAQRTVALLERHATPDDVIDAVFLNRQPRVAVCDYYWRVTVDCPSDGAPLSGDRIPARCHCGRIVLRSALFFPF